MTRLGLMMSRFVVTAGFSGCVLLACNSPFKDSTKPVAPRGATTVTQKQSPPARRLAQPTTPPVAATTQVRASEPAGQQRQPASVDTNLLNILNPLPASRQQQPKSPMRDPASRPGVDNTDDAVVKATCAKIDHKLDRVSFDECWGLGLRQTGYYSVKGTPILQKIFPPKPGVKPLGRVTLIGGIHGNELSSVSVTFKWLQKLQRHHSGIFHWTVIPLLNPDGSLRKRSARVNGNGVDLNRNLPTPDWQRQSQEYWIKYAKRNPTRYPGPSPASEPETQWLIHHIETFKPDVIIAVHSLYYLVDYDAADRRAAPQRIGMLEQNFLGTYPGSLGNYAGLHKGIPVMTLELPHSWELPTPKQMTKMWVDLVGWLKRNVGDAKVNRIAKHGRPSSR